MYTRPDRAHARLDRRASSPSTPQVRDANLAAFKAGHAFGETAELFDHPYAGPARPRCEPGTYTNITGNTALAWGLVAAGQLSEAAAVPRLATRSRRPPTSSTSCRSTRTSACARCRPRTRSPASAPRSARPSAATSASPPPAVPGIALKSETMGLAVSLELPLLIIDIQRGGPSTGLPTKTEAADLLHGHVRPPRRVAAADRRRRTARRTASTPPSRRPASRSSTARR